MFLLQVFLNFLLVLQVIHGHEYAFMEDKPVNPIYEENDNKVEEPKFNRRISIFSSPADIFKRSFRSAVSTGMVPLYKTSNEGQCFCNMRFQPIDLGREYYPRYLQTGICQPNSCNKFQQCVERKYKIKVLRKREIKDGEESMYSSLPKPLRDFWVAETIPVGVACDCVVDVSYTNNM
ncbi:prothoracicotropic hormone-like [Diorhabda sublineata]|uniref:prothoracicotropic hormone-like n=1 Tax=Diorhabda sublineata TaxID=1163346 RepID=UPI0024E19208|nr:prothoracicotropic hormone-like [Diorhabda sublineata]